MSVARRGLLALVAAAAFIVCFLLLLLAAGLMELTPGDIPRPTIPVFLVVALGMPAFVATTLTRRLSRRWQRATESRSPGRRRRIAAWAVGGAYALTAVFGVPAAVSHQNAWAVAEYKRIQAEGQGRVWDVHPYIWSYAAVPVLPGVVLAYHEYQLAGLYGLGAFDVVLWYGAGEVSLGQLPIWIS